MVASEAKTVQKVKIAFPKVNAGNIFRGFQKQTEINILLRIVGQKSR